jgi:REP element-mobilizing transposase RayT
MMPKMASTYLSLSYHLVFGTKNREPMIDAQWRVRLHEYLGGTVHGLGGIPTEIGGIADHVHILVNLKATHVLADVVRELKKASSIWIHHEIGTRSFAWQEGYAAFTISATSSEAVRQYIRKQEEHHRKRSYREEVQEMLTKAGVAFEPRYLE